MQARTWLERSPAARVTGLKKPRCDLHWPCWWCRRSWRQSHNRILYCCVERPGAGRRHRSATYFVCHAAGCTSGFISGWPLCFGAPLLAAVTSGHSFCLTLLCTSKFIVQLLGGNTRVRLMVVDFRLAQRSADYELLLCMACTSGAAIPV